MSSSTSSAPVKNARMRLKEWGDRQGVVVQYETRATTDGRFQSRVIIPGYDTVFRAKKTTKKMAQEVAARVCMEHLERSPAAPEKEIGDLALEEEDEEGQAYR